MHLKIYFLSSTHTIHNRPALSNAVTLCKLEERNPFGQLQFQGLAWPAKVPSGEGKGVCTCRQT